MHMQLKLHMGGKRGHKNDGLHRKHYQQNKLISKYYLSQNTNSFKRTDRKKLGAKLIKRYCYLAPKLDACQFVIL